MLDLVWHTSAIQLRDGYTTLHKISHREAKFSTSVNGYSWRGPHRPSMKLRAQLPSKEWFECQLVFEQPIVFPAAAGRLRMFQEQPAKGRSSEGSLGTKGRHQGTSYRDLTTASRSYRHLIIVGRSAKLSPKLAN